MHLPDFPTVITVKHKSTAIKKKRKSQNITTVTSYTILLSYSTVVIVY